MTLLECLTLCQPSQAFYFNLKVRYDRINEIMGSPHSSIYSPTLLFLVGSLLNPNWTLRPTFSKISTEYEPHMKRDYAIRTIRSIESHKTSLKEKKALQPFLSY